jgi:hypothetical protein
MPRRYDRQVRGIVLLLAAFLFTAGSAPKTSAGPFEAQVRPILERRCVPCHFAGGSMYQKLPFDRPATVLRLREKLFTRIKNEGDRKVIRAFLAATPAARS